MVVRRRLGAVLVDVGEDVEIGIRVVIQRVDAALGIGSAIGGDERLVGQKLRQILSNFLPSIVALIGPQGVAGVVAELLEGIGHRVAPGLSDVILQRFTGRAKPDLAVSDLPAHGYDRGRTSNPSTKSGVMP